jgi:hypothetical protein
MTTFGNVLLALTMLLGTLAFGLTASLLKHRDGWQAAVIKAKDNYEQVSGNLIKRQNEVAAANTELQRAMLSWGQIWNNVPVQIFNAQNGVLQLGIGQNAGLSMEGVQGNIAPTLYAFQPDPTGEGFLYVGQFKVTNITGTNATVQLTRLPRPNEVATWRPGAWRFRDEMPQGQVVRFDDLGVQITIATEQGNERLEKIKTEQANLAKAITQLDQRIAELNGLPNAPANAPEVLKKGLVASIQEEDASRNADLAELNRLRHDLFTKYNLMLKLKDDNLALEAKLPGGETVINAPKTNQSAKLD